MTERRPSSVGGTPGDGVPAAPAAAATAWVEAWFLRAALGIGAAAWLGLLVAELGRLRLGLVAALLAAGALALAAHARFVRPGRPAAAPAPKFGGGGLAGFCAVTLVAGYLFHPPYETVVNGSDGTVYLNLSRKIADTGALVFDDPLLGGLPVEARDYLFLNRQPGDFWYGRHTRYPGGFLIADVAEPEVSSGFSPLFPVVAALFHQAFPPRGALFVAPVFATLAVGGLFLVGARCGGLRAGLLAALLAAVSLPQIWFARYPVPEMVAQFFVVAGLLALLAAFRDDRPWLAAAAGGFFGMAAFAKIDLLVLLPVALTAFVAWRLLARPEGGDRPLVFLLAGFGPLAAHNLAHYLAYPSPYALYVGQLLDRSFLLAGLGAVLLALLAAGGAGLLAVRRGAGLGPWRRRAVGWVLAGLLAGYAAVYATATGGRWPEPLVWLSWYLSWPVLGLCLAGLLWLPWSGRAGRSDQGVTFLLVLTGVVGLHYLYDPLETGEHVWSMRRFVPVVLPGMLVVTALAAGRLVDWVYFEFRGVAATVLAALLVGFVGGPGTTVLGESLWEDVLDQSADVAGTFPEDAAVLVSPDLVGTHVQTTLAYLHDVETVLVQEVEPDDVVGDVAFDWLAAGRPVFIVTGRQGFSLHAPELVLTEVRQASIDFRTLEETRGEAPRDVVDVSIGLRILQATRSEASTARTAVDVGHLADDLVAGLRGFHAAERDAGGSFRWTGDQASIAVPGGDRIRLVVAGARPPEAEPAEIAVWAGPHPIAEGLVVGNVPHAIVLDLPPSERAGATELTIRSTAFRPRALGLSADSRNLGVRVYRVEVLSDAPNAASPDRPAAPDAVF